MTAAASPRRWTRKGNGQVLVADLASELGVYIFQGDGRGVVFFDCGSGKELLVYLKQARRGYPAGGRGPACRVRGLGEAVELAAALRSAA